MMSLKVLSRRAENEPRRVRRSDAQARRFETRARAVQWAVVERQAIEKGGTQWSSRMSCRFEIGDRESESLGGVRQLVARPAGTRERKAPSLGIKKGTAQ
jgi:hypothetical protein